MQGDDSRRVRGAAGVLGAVLMAMSLASCAWLVSSPAPPTYYISPYGSDAATGTSPSAAWQTLGKAASVTMPPGTRLFLQGGQVFWGNLTLGQHDAGDAARPVLVSSYGNGRATIAAGQGSGIAVYDTAGVDIRGLSITGPSAQLQSGAGINVYSNLPGNRKLTHVAISDVHISGFANGIAIGGANGTTGFRDVQISNSVLHDNLDAGLLIYGPPFRAVARNYANQDVRVSHVVAYQNRGNPHITADSSGSGIVLGSVRGGTVEWSTAYDNGGAGASRPGPEGIWAYDSTRIIIEHSLSYDKQTRDMIDGNGFGLDLNTSESCLEYNLSYGNDGAGYLLYTLLRNGSAAGNIMRFNISSGDVRDQNSHFAGIIVSGLTENSSIYQNTVVMQPAPSGYSPALVLGGSIRGVTVRNNIFARSTGPVIIADGTLRTTDALLQGNDYSTTTPSWSVLWGPALYTSLPAWRSATGQEIAAGHPAGFTAYPRFDGPVLGLRAGTSTEADLARGFALRPGSPLIGRGLNLQHYLDAPSAQGGLPSVVALARHPDVGAG